ncbi:MAG TPA: guanylate kinase [bacterium]|nr:guanylate kinase [bacterium]HPJ72369.1 guanylate kinase [bacterium]HPQ65136.1 guanylate kinase [bacterium]
MKGELYIVTAPSGAGKTTICDAVLELEERLKYSVSATTREPRRGEIDGRDYFFISREEFEKRRDRGELLEHAEVYGNYYGTPKEYIEKELAEGNDIILDIDVQGALSVKNMGYPATYIYILPPSLRELRKRLEGRGTDSPEVIRKRSEQARRELDFLPEYDFCIVNDDLQTAIEDMKAIIRGERCRVDRHPGIVDAIAEG